MGGPNYACTDYTEGHKENRGRGGMKTPGGTEQPG